MVLKILLILSCNVLLIKSQDDQVLIDGSKTDRCSIKPEHTFTDGQTVNIVINSRHTINFGRWRINDTKLIKNDFKEQEFKTKVDPSFAGKWGFELLHLKDNIDVRGQMVQYEGHNYTQRICSTMVKIAPAKGPNIIIIIIAVGVVFTLIILAQAAYIVYLKAKTKAINRHENLSKKSESVNSNDRARYCTNPRQNPMKVVPMIEPDRGSAIYEAPSIQLPERGPAQPLQAPQPPAVATIPRTPRIDPDIGRMGPHALAAAMTGSRHPAPTGPYPAPKPIHHEVNVANRPPLPLPPQETYEEMPTEENTYEPPPIKNLPPVKPSVNQKLTKEQLDTAVKALSMKPAITPKPQKPVSDHMKIPNELENAWRRRNVVQVPIVSIPGPSSRGTSPHKPNFTRPPSGSIIRPARNYTNVILAPKSIRPPPVVKSKPPLPPPVEQDIYYNRQDSSDEEWTYEPLKPVKDYGSDNIYNV